MTTPALEHRSIPRRIVGRYALFEAIASGGMAAVHLGRLMGPVGFSRTVAIKRLHENYASDPEFVAMFLDEARIVARIRHPNVVPMLDVVALERELLLVMEYVTEGPERSAPAAPQATASSGPVVVDLDELSTKPASAAESADVAAPNSMSTRKRAVQVPLVKPASHKASSADSLYKRD